MRVGVVLHPFGTAAKGLEQYVYESTKSMVAAGAGIEYTVFVKGTPDTTGLPSSASIVNLPNNMFWKWHLWRWRNNVDTFIFFTESSPVWLWRRSVIVFFDAAYYYFGGEKVSQKVRRYFQIIWRGSMLRAARHVVTISHASARDLEQTFSVSKSNISVIYPGFKSLIAAPERGGTTRDIPYFMYVGPKKERKNVLAIVKAFNTFKETTGLPHQLVLVGRSGGGAYAEKVQAAVESSDYQEDIVHETSVSDSELQDLYTKAEALVFPSLLEGFGLPVLEALSCNCMVITAETTSTKEAAGEAGMLVNPEDDDELAEAMVKVARGDYNRETFLAQAKEQVSHFSWENSGREWSTVLQKVVHEHESQ